jgi:hypothetical protein
LDQKQGNAAHRPPFTMPHVLVSARLLILAIVP